MKIIDDKGRLFGKINVIDFLALLFLLCLTPMFYFGYKLYVGNKKAEAELKEKASKQSLADTQKSEPIEEKESLSTNAEVEINSTLINQLNDRINKIANVEKKIDDLNNRIDNLEGLDDRMTNLEGLKNRIATLEEKVNLILSSPKIRKFKKQ